MERADAGDQSFIYSPYLPPPAGTGHLTSSTLPPQSPKPLAETDDAKMRFTVACLAGLAASAVAAPVEKRANTLPPVDSATDESVLQLALYLEHLELALYTGGYEKFTDAEYTAAGFPAGFRGNVGVIAQVCYSTGFMIHGMKGTNDTM